MKQFFLLLILLTPFCDGICSHAQELDGPLQGPVKSILESDYIAKNSKGVIVKKRVTNQTLRTFNEYGFLTSDTWLNHLMEGEYLRKNVYTYLHDTLILTYESSLQNGNVTERSVNTYDEDLQRIEARYYTNLETYDYKYAFYYDAAGRQTGSALYGPKDELYSKSEYEFDAEGRIERSVFVGKSGIATSTEWEYEDGVHCTKRILFDANGTKIGSSEISYDENSNVTMYKSMDADNTIRFHEVYAFDDYGNKTEVTKYLPNGEVSYAAKYTYTYDAHNNWISRTRISSDKRVTISEREITYY